MNIDTLVPLEGIIQKVSQKEDGVQNIDEYEVLVTLPNGNETIIDNVRIVSMFGGILNTSRYRPRVSFKDNEQSNYDTDSHIGDKVIIQFLSGNINKPIITGFIPNNKSESILTEEQKEPQIYFDFQGFKFHIDEEGSLIIQHKGAPFLENDDLKQNDSPEVITDISINKEGTVKFNDSNQQIWEMNVPDKKIFFGSEKDYVEISLSGQKVDIITQKEVNVKTKFCTINASQVSVNSPHIIMDTGKKCKAEFKDAQWEISTPGFKLLKDTTVALQELISTAPTFAYHPSLGPIQMDASTLKTLTELNVKVNLAKLS